MLVAVADTHTVIWYIYADRRLFHNVQSFIQSAATSRNTIGVSSITLVEMIYLAEKQKIAKDALLRLGQALQQPSKVLTEIPLYNAIARTLRQVNVKDIPDMPDRIIAASALHYNVPLLTRDAKIQSSSIPTIW